MLEFIAEHTALSLMVLAFLLNLLLGYRSQIDAWCEAHPILAAPLKALRGAGPDPWLIVQAANLAVKKKLPEAIRSDVNTIRLPDGRTVGEALSGTSTKDMLDAFGAPSEAAPPVVKPLQHDETTKP